MFRFISFIIAAHLCCSSLIGQEKAIEIEVKGSGPDLLFLPGFACPGNVWDTLVSELSKTHTCHVVSYAGFNGIQPLKEEWLVKVINSLEHYILKEEIRPSLIGHSLGGSAHNIKRM